MQYWKTILSIAVLGMLIASPSFATTKAAMNTQDEAIKEINVKCINCHLKENNSLVQQWKNSPHAAAQDGQVACYNCHAADDTPCNQGQCGYLDNRPVLPPGQDGNSDSRPEPGRPG